MRELIANIPVINLHSKYTKTVKNRRNDSIIFLQNCLQFHNQTSRLHTNTVQVYINGLQIVTPTCEIRSKHKCMGKFCNRKTRWGHELETHMHKPRSFYFEEICIHVTPGESRHEISHKNQENTQDISGRHNSDM